MARPRERRIDDAVLPVALDLLLDHGLDGLSLVDVAARAGGQPAEPLPTLVGQAHARTGGGGRRDRRAADPGGTAVRTRLVSLLSTVDVLTVAGRLGRLGDGTEDLELMRRCRERFTSPRRAQLVQELRRGVKRGEVRRGADLELVVDALTAPLLLRSVAMPPTMPGGSPDGGLPPVDVRALVDLVLDGVRPGPRG
ncbi:MAG: TetR-like C-terminal domain-containing protein [Angustibacter sp.]